jgi:hypothetical protein
MTPGEGPQFELLADEPMENCLTEIGFDPLGRVWITEVVY